MTREELIKLGYKIINFNGTDEEHTKLLPLLKNQFIQIENY
jgi:hypothetical protein